MPTSFYTTKWFFQCFLDRVSMFFFLLLFSIVTWGRLFSQHCLILSLQTPFTLSLRIWDIYILEGERILTAMSYTILKLHRSKKSVKTFET